jgi:YidC/Oxa1 family membrane protein insertase
VSTDLVKATISAQGGDLVQLELLRYKEHDDKDKTLSCSMPSINIMAQSGLIGEGLPTPSHDLQAGCRPNRTG